jgi:uncharacterized protein (TIGR02996 family)
MDEAETPLRAVETIARARERLRTPPPERFPELLAAVIADPHGDLPRIDYADACVEAGDARGDLIRHQLMVTEIRRDGGSVSEWIPSFDHAGELLQANRRAWLAELEPFLDAGVIRDPVFLRGFVEAIELVGDIDLAILDELYRIAPILHLTIFGGPDAVRRLAASAALDRIVSLRVAGAQLDDDAFAALADSPHLGKLAYLDASANRLGVASLEAIARRLPNLGYLAWKGNACEDPTDVPRLIHGVVVESLPTDRGRELEAKFGRQAWLHSPSRWPSQFPPFMDAFE